MHRGLRRKPGIILVEGREAYSRNERNANSGLVVAIDPARDLPGDPLAGIALQRHWESSAYIAGGTGYAALLGICGLSAPDITSGADYRVGLKMFQTDALPPVDNKVALW